MTDAIVMPTHPQFKNLEGQTFGRLTVISYAGKSTSCLTISCSLRAPDWRSGARA
jgi:hypothetical protein